MPWGKREVSWDFGHARVKKLRRSEGAQWELERQMGFVFPVQRPLNVVRILGLGRGRRAMEGFWADDDCGIRRRSAERLGGFPDQHRKHLIRIEISDLKR